ncbi:MAG: hypothetical protein ACWGOX_14835 [Desulforhopalus sp.]
MKYVVSVLLTAAICALAMAACAEEITESPVPPEYGESVSRLILQNRSVLYGPVSETKQGIVITTSRGTFLLKGADLEEFIGKNVRVTGVVRHGSVFPLKISTEL